MKKVFATIYNGLITFHGVDGSGNYTLSTTIATNLNSNYYVGFGTPIGVIDFKYRPPYFLPTGASDYPLDFDATPVAPLAYDTLYPASLTPQAVMQAATLNYEAKTKEYNNYFLTLKTQLKKCVTDVINPVFVLDVQD